MSDRDDMLLEALTSLINAKFSQQDAKFSQLDEKLTQVKEELQESHRRDIQKINFYIENVLEKKLNAFYK